MLLTVSAASETQVFRGGTRYRARFRRALAGAAAVAVAFSALVLADSAPASAAVQTIQFEAPHNHRVVLGELASRSQRKPVTISGIGPYTVRGTDSRTGQPYEFVTDWNYNPAISAGWARESDERALNSESWTSNLSASYEGRSGVMQLSSNANCNSNNNFDGMTTYCSTFGPDVYTAPFTASVGQAVSFDWAAERVTDDYEIYAYLVKVDGTGYGTAADHTLIAYGRGNKQGWTTTSKEIPADGTYRFRFVNGSYDQTGGYALGSNMYIDKVVKLGLANPIAFDGLPDRIKATSNFTVSATAPGGAVTFSSSTPSICSVSGTTVAVSATNTGICTIVANQAGGGDYVPAETVARSFRVLDAPTAPTNAGMPIVSGTVAEGETVTASEGTWTDGGSPITGTSYQWVSTVGGTSTPITGETSQNCYLVKSPGSKLTVIVTKTNGIGSTSASSAALDGFTCSQPAAPAWPAQALGDLRVGTAVTTTFQATGVTAPSYSVAAGALPDGLTLNTTTGVVSGTPATAGPYTFTLRATNPSGTADLVVSGVVNASPGPITGAPDAFVVGTAAAGSVSATGTPAPSYTVTSGALPTGVQLDAATGAFSGTPTSAGAYAFTVTAANGIGTPSTREFTGTVAEAPGWDAGQGMSPTVGVPLDVQFTAEGTPAPAYSIGEGALPDGLSLDPDTGRVTGTPTTPGPFSFTIVATNELGSSSLLVAGTVTAAPGPISGAPGDWVAGEPTTGSVSATGTPSPVYAVTDGALPDGITLDPTTGVFSGVPTAPGPYSFTVSAENGVGTASAQSFSGIVNAAPLWVDTTIVSPRVGEAFSDAIRAEGTPDPVYTVTAGSLPAGLSLDEVTGAITGTPTVPGPYSFTVTADNGIGEAAVQEFTGVVLQSPVSNGTPKLPRLVVGAPVSVDLSVGVQATPAPTYRVTSGKLPDGLTLDERTGLLSGTPTTAGAYSFTVTVDNGTGEPLTFEFSSAVESAPAVGGLAVSGSAGFAPLALGGAALLLLGGAAFAWRLRQRVRRSR